MPKIPPPPPPPPPPPTPSTPTNPHQALTSPSHPTLSGPGPGLLQGRSATESEHASGSTLHPAALPPSVYSLACKVETREASVGLQCRGHLRGFPVTIILEAIVCSRAKERREGALCENGRGSPLVRGGKEARCTWCPCTHGKEGRRWCPCTHGKEAR
jgi:hypothetical protein